MNTTENNKLIAEFMGYETYDHTDSIAIRLSNGNEFNSEAIGHIHVKFHTSWDWLMPVVGEIDHLEYESERLDKIEMAIKTRQINAVHKAVVEFIKWYNENK
jgi:hypothetical protein